jgi:hypothetical protein
MKTDIEKTHPPKEEIAKQPKQTIDRQRKIKDTYTSNSLPVFNAEESVEYNKCKREQYFEKVKRVNSIFSSESLKSSVFNQNDDYDKSTDKITNKLQLITIDENPKKYVKTFKTITSNGKTIYQ